MSLENLKKVSLNDAVVSQTLFEEEHKKTMKRLVVAFDLDHTLIDSTHRITLKEDGSLDLNAWHETCTWEYIQRDTLLPLYHHFKSFKEMGVTVIAVTAREMRDADFKYLEKYGLNFDYVLYRENSQELDHDLKNGKFAEFLSQDGRIPFLFYDDKQENLDVASKYGFAPLKAQLFNLKTVVKNWHSIRNVCSDTIKDFNPKEEDLALSKIKYR